jgi:hypothetical protein
MGVRSILLDENLLIDLLFTRPMLTGHGDLLWELCDQGLIQGWVTEFGLEKIWHYAFRSRGKAIANKLLEGLYRNFICCPVHSDNFRSAEASHLPLECALQLAAAAQRELDGIVTNRPFDYHKCIDFSEVLIYTPGQLLADFLESSLEDRREGLESQYTDAGTTGQGGVVTAGLRLEYIDVCCGSEQPTAKVKVQTPLGRVYEQTASGVGPVDASFRAIDLAISQFMPMADIQMIYYKSQGTTSDSEVSAMVLLQRRMSLYAGRGFHPDIVLASAYAYLDALNYLLYCEE